MKRARIFSAIALTGLIGFGWSAWALQQGPEDPPARPGVQERRGRTERLLRLMESDRGKEELGLSDDQVQRIHQVIVDTTKASIKTGADLAVRRIELRELLRADNPDRDAATKKVQEISNLRGELIKLRVEAMIAAKKVLTPEQQKKIRAFREMRREEARRRRGMMGMIERMGRQPGPAPTPPPGPGSVPKPPAQ